MLATAIIVFREVLEAALIVGIVLAASRGVARRGLWVGYGVAAGVAGACIVAVFAEVIAAAAEGFGQELFNAGILLIAVFMLGWHQVWMSRHGREMAGQMKDLGHSVREGGRPLHVLAIVVGAAILREGSEAVLFLFGVAATDDAATGRMLVGGLVGLAMGAVCGSALYLGLLKIPAHKLFAVTGWMILLLAAGMASQAAAFLAQAGVLPALGEQVWNSSFLLSSKDSILGKVLHTLVGYDDRPAGIQLVFYGLTLIAIVVLTRLVGPVKRAAIGTPTSESTRLGMASSAKH